MMTPQDLSHPGPYPGKRLLSNPAHAMLSGDASPERRGAPRVEAAATPPAGQGRYGKDPGRNNRHPVFFTGQPARKTYRRIRGHLTEGAAAPGLTTSLPQSSTNPDAAIPPPRSSLSWCISGGRGGGVSGCTSLWPQRCTARPQTSASLSPSSIPLQRMIAAGALLRTRCRPP